MALAAILVLASISTAHAEVTATIVTDSSQRFGVHAEGLPQLFNPAPVQLGSSLSHWDSASTPNLLMEAFISPDLPFLGLDVTPQLMRDLGWEEGSLDIVVWDLSGPDLGLSDPRPFSGDPGNAAATFGEARLSALEVLLTVWAGTLESAAEVDVLVLYTPLFCEAGVGAVLAGAGTLGYLFEEGTSSILPFADTLYPAALAEALFGGDLTGSPVDGGGDLFIVVNDDIDRECLGATTRFSYRTDGSAVPPNHVDFVETILHELGHGLGMANATDESTGERTTDPAFPTIFDRFTADTRRDKTWAALNRDQRLRSATDTGRVVWNGEHVEEAVEEFWTGGAQSLVIDGLPSLDGLVTIQSAAFGPQTIDEPVSAPIACMIDDVLDPTTLNGCSAPVDPGSVAGQIALVDRGACTFADKTRMAQEAGALGVIVINDRAGLPPLGGISDDIVIPTVGVSSPDGNRIREAVCPGSALFLQDYRFQVTSQWTAGAQTGPGHPAAMTANTGFFWFFGPNNLELVTKAVSGCGSVIDGYLFGLASLTDVGVLGSMLDMVTGLRFPLESVEGQPTAAQLAIVPDDVALLFTGFPMCP